MRRTWQRRQRCSGIEHAIANRLSETSRTRRRSSALSAVWCRSPRHSQLALHLRYPAGPDRPSRPTPHALLDFLVGRHHPFLQIERLSNRRTLTLPLKSRYHVGQKVGPAMLQTSRAVAPPVRPGDANRLYYSQTRSRQEAGLFDFRGHERRSHGENHQEEDGG